MMQMRWPGAAVTPVNAAFEMDADGNRGYIRPRKSGSHQGIVQRRTLDIPRETIRVQASIGARELVAGTGGEDEPDRNAAMVQGARRTLVRGSVALYGANKYRISTRNRFLPICSRLSGS